LYEAFILLTYLQKLEEKTVDLGKGPQQILQIYQPGHEEVCVVCLHGAILKEQLAAVEVVAKNSIAQVSDEWPICVEALGFTNTLTRLQYETGEAYAATQPARSAPKPAAEKLKRKSGACEEPGCGNEAAWGAKRRCESLGGGARCEETGCGNSAQGSTARCKSHGGGARCDEPGCGKSAQGSTARCAAHGAARAARSRAAANLHVGLLFRKSFFLYRKSEAANEKYCYELHARSGLRFAIRHQEDAWTLPASN
jgi:hypothetical protein